MVMRNKQKLPTANCSIIFLHITQHSLSWHPRLANHQLPMTLTWTPSHLERKKDRQHWTPDNWGIHMADATQPTTDLTCRYTISKPQNYMQHHIRWHVAKVWRTLPFPRLPSEKGTGSSLPAIPGKAGYAPYLLWKRAHVLDTLLPNLDAHVYPDQETLSQAKRPKNKSSLWLDSPLS
jgi:hypothetical protein